VTKREPGPPHDRPATLLLAPPGQSLRRIAKTRNRVLLSRPKICHQVPMAGGGEAARYFDQDWEKVHAIGLVVVGIVAKAVEYSWSPRVVSRLEALIRSGEDEALFRVNPIKFAADKGMAEAEAIDLFLYAAAHGLFEMNWMLLCSYCGCVAESFSTMNRLHDHPHCNLCQVDLEAKLDDYIAVTFTASPQVRAIKFHQPEALSPEEYCFVYNVAPEGKGPDGRIFGAMIRDAMLGLSFLPPGAVTRFEFDIKPGLLLGWSPLTDAGFAFNVDAAAAPTEQTVRVRFTDSGCVPDSTTLTPGRLVLEVESAVSYRSIFGISLIPPEINIFDRPPLKYDPFLSGSRLLTTQTFRNLFRSQVIEATEGIGVRDLTLLFTDLKGSTELYDRIGDLNAYSQVQRHFERLLDVTVRHNGAVVKTIGDAIMAAFVTPSDAVGAAIKMRSEIERLNEARAARDFILKIGIHRGPSIAVTLNDRLDYFGQTVNIASRVEHLAEGDEICLTEEVYDAPGVADLLTPYAKRRDHSHLKGVQQDVAVFRIQGAA
jgi:class 3 adenylate cyclase